ncbi:MAG: LysR family transcriptional regulator [Rhizomicrobium sp.]
MMDRLTGIEVFVHAVRLGGLSAAARQMRLSPTMAARHLSALEDRLGVSLVHRTTRRLSLTEAGASYLEKAERILADLGEADAEASSRTLMVEGNLRLSAPSAFGLMHVVPLLAQFTERHPAVTVDLGLDDRYVDLLQERWDLAIRIGHLADSSLVARKLAPVRLVICAAPHYLALHGVPHAVADLNDHACLGYTLSPGVSTDRWRFGKSGDIRVPVHGALIANHGSALVQAAIAGMGLVLGPRFLAAPALARGELVEVSLDVELPDLGAIYAVTHPSRRPAAKTRAFISFLDEMLTKMAVQW